jgi:sugar lactone lactonase YvrE
MSDTFKQYHPAKAMVAILCMLLFLACLALFAWASNKGATVIGSAHITANTAHVLVTLNDEILVLDTNGALQERYSLEALGIGSYPIDLRLQDDSTLLVATQKTAGLYVCDYPGWQCRVVESPLFEQLRSQIKVLPDPAGEGLFVSDTAGGHLHWLSADGQNTRVLTTAKWFKQVNDIALDDKRRLWVADSGNRRIVILQADANGDWSIIGELSAKSGQARPGLDWPMMIALSPDENAWVVQPDATGTRADLLLYDAQLGVKARIDLPEDAYPTDVVRSGKGMLVTDMDDFQIMRVDIDSHSMAPFGDHQVQEILDAAARERADADRMMDIALVGMVLFGLLMIAMAFWATPKGQRFTQHPKGPTLEAREGMDSRSGSLHWLVRDVKTEKFVRIVQRMLLLTTAGMLGLLVYTWYLLNSFLGEEAAQQAATCVTGISEMLAVLGVLALGAPVLGYLGLRHLRNRLGSDGHYLHIRLHDGRHLTLDPARLVYTGRILAYENHLFPIQTGNRKPLYVEGEIETHIAPLLSRATRLGTFAMMRYQFRHQEPATMAAVSYIVVVTAVLWYTGIWRLLLPGN